MKRIAVTPKYDSRAKLDGAGLGVCTKASAFGWVPRNASIGVGDGLDGSVGRQSAQEFQEFLACPRGKSVGRMADDVSVNVLAQVETNRKSARIRVRGVVSHERNPRRVREAQRDRCGRANCVRRA
jgi:hypothetical protein